MKSYFFFALGLLALRVLLLLAALEPAEERIAEIFDPTGIAWEYGPERPLFDREELYTGTAAAAMRRDLAIPSSTYQFMTYGGGSLLTAYAALGIYNIFGENYLAFKLLPLLVTLLGGLFWFGLARQMVGDRIAFAFATLYVFAPSMFVRTSLIAKGDHAEAMAWVGFVLWAAARAAAPGPRQRTWAVLAGLAAGLGVFVTYSVVPVLVGVFGVALLRSRGRPAQLWGFGGGALLVGLLPWILTLIAEGEQLLHIYGQPLAGGPLLTSTIGTRATALVNSGFFAGYDLAGGGVPRRVGALIFLIAVVGGWIGWARWARRDHEAGDRPWALLALAGTVAHLFAFLVLAPGAASRYLAPVYPLLLLAAASLVNARPSLRVLPAAVALLGALALGTTLREGAWTATRLPLAGTDWPLLGEIVGQKLSPEQIANLPPDVRPHFWVGFGIKVFASAAKERWAEGAAFAPDADRRFVWEGVGIGLMGSPRAFTEGPYLQSIPAEARDAIVHGMARYGEVAFAALAVRRPDIDLASAELRMTGSPSRELTSSRARTIMSLAVHGVEVPSRQWTDLPSDVTREAVGFATFAGSGRNTLRRYPIRTPGVRVTSEDDPSLWRGLGRALGIELGVSTLTMAQREAWIERMKGSVPESASARFSEAARAQAITRIADM